MWIFALQSFNLRMPLTSSQHFPVWVALQVTVQVIWSQPGMCSSLLRCQCLFLCLQTSPLTLRSPVHQMWGYLGSMVVVRFDSLCVACKVSVYACMVLCMDSSVGWSTCWSIMVRYCSLSVRFNSSAAGVYW